MVPVLVYAYITLARPDDRRSFVRTMAACFKGNADTHDTVQGLDGRGGGVASPSDRHLGGGDGRGADARDGVGLAAPDGGSRSYACGSGRGCCRTWWRAMPSEVQVAQVGTLFGVWALAVTAGRFRAGVANVECFPILPFPWLD